MIRMIVAPLLFFATAAGAQQCVYKEVMTDAEIEACRHPAPAVSTTTKPGSNAKQPAYNLERHGGSYSGAATDKQAWEHMMPPTRYSAEQIEEPVIGQTTTADGPKLEKWCAFYPTKNVTKNAHGTHEQWVCHGNRRYLYFDNGVLTSIQE